ncbi:unnamed protein product [Ilex paraguariensis]|uniref:Uncharacterized protein n=1 Tax=Ilex paraguariensis TaxID=185542 RepID=A0ABC8QZ69_9AQUA
MSTTLSNSPTMRRPKTTSLQPQVSTFPPTIQNTMYKSSTNATTMPEKMGTKIPIEIGTRGTIGSLIMQEIEYFSQLELGCRNASEKSRCQVTGRASTSSYSRPKVVSLIRTPKKKKGGSRFIPRMCSVVEVADNQPNVISGFNYRNLKADVQRVQV